MATLFKSSLLPILLFSSQAICGQNSYDTVQIGIQPLVYRKILNTQFSNLITGQTKTSIGNFASLDLKEAEVAFAGNIISKSGSVLTVKASGAVTDGFFPIFQNSTLNSNIAIEAQYNFLGLKRRSLVYYADSYKRYLEKEKNIYYKYSQDSLKYARAQHITLLKLREQNLTRQIQSLNNLMGQNSECLKCDSISYEIARTNLILDSVHNAIQGSPVEDYYQNEAINEAGRQVDKLYTEIEIYGFNIGWWSIGYKLSSNKFKRFDSTKLFDDQVTSESFATSEIKLQYSRYKWSTQSFTSFFFCLGGIISYSDNFKLLEKYELSETRNYGPTNGVRANTSKFNSYIGNYQENLIGLKLFSDFYYFLFDNNSAAFHIYPEYNIQNKIKPVWNFGAGFLFSFQDSKTENSIVNAELYYNFLDISNSENSKNKLFERNEIGIRFSFPIKFISYKSK